MKTATKKLCAAAVCLALALLLPFLTGQMQSLGNALCPMHLPVLLCGYLCGGVWGLCVGLIAPLLRFALFGMPPVYPLGLAMSLELGCYGLIAGLLYKRLPKTTPMLYVSLVTAMLGGRLVWGLSRYAFAGLSGSSFPFSAFLAGAVTNALPGIVLQLVLIPLLVTALQKVKKSA